MPTDLLTERIRRHREKFHGDRLSRVAKLLELADDRVQTLIEAESNAHSRGRLAQAQVFLNEALLALRTDASEGVVPASASVTDIRTKSTRS